MKVKSTTKTVITENQTIELAGGLFICHQTIINGELTDQYFTTKNTKKSHPFTYENRHLRFKYYPDTSFLDSKELAFGEWHKCVPPPVIVEDLENFKDFDRLLLIWLEMDNQIYKITSPYALPHWFSQDYLGGFTNKNFDLDKVVKKLEKFNWVKNIKIEDIPYYNKDFYGHKGIYFEFIPSASLIKKISDKRAKISRDEFGIFGVHSGGLDVFNLKSLYQEETEIAKKTESDY